MIKEFVDKDLKKEDLDEFNNQCEECKKKDESVSQNLILTGFKICKSCQNFKNCISNLTNSTNW